MPDTLVFVGCDVAECEQLAVPYRNQGWRAVVQDAAAPDALDHIAECTPLAAVFSFSDGSGDGLRELARSVLGDDRMSRPLLVFVGGDGADVAQTRSEMPFGVFVKPEELGWVLKHLVYRA